MKGWILALVTVVVMAAGIVAALGGFDCDGAFGGGCSEAGQPDSEAQLKALEPGFVLAHALPGTVTITWEDRHSDAIAAGVLEYRVYRRPADRGPWVQVGRADPHKEGPYSVVDTTAASGTSYVYGVSEIKPRDESEVVETAPLVAQ